MLSRGGNNFSLLRVRVVVGTEENKTFPVQQYHATPDDCIEKRYFYK